MWSDRKGKDHTGGGAGTEQEGLEDEISFRVQDKANQNHVHVIAAAFISRTDEDPSGRVRVSVPSRRSLPTVPNER